MNLPSARLFSIAVLALFLQGSIKSCGLFYTGELLLEQTLEISESAALSVQSSGGLVNLERGPDGKVSLAMTFHVRAGDRAKVMQLLKRLRDDPPIARENNKIQLGDLSKYQLPSGGFFSPSISIDFQLKVPEGVSLDVQTDSGDLTASRVHGILKAELDWGSASVTSFEGRLDIQTTHGRLDVANTRGETQLASAAGPIFITDVRGDLTVEAKKGSIELDSEITPGARWHLQTESGDVSLMLPRDSNFLIYVRTQSGAIKIDFPLTTTGLRGDWQMAGQIGPKTDTRIEIITQSGKIAIGRK